MAFGQTSIWAPIPKQIFDGKGANLRKNFNQSCFQSPFFGTLVQQQQQRKRRQQQQQQQQKWKNSDRFFLKSLNRAIDKLQAFGVVRVTFFFCLSVCLSVCLFVYLRLYVSLSVSFSVCIHLSVSGCLTALNFFFFELIDFVDGYTACLAKRGKKGDIAVHFWR